MPIELNEFWTATLPALATATLLGSAWIAVQRRKTRKTPDRSPPAALPLDPPPVSNLRAVAGEADARAWESLRAQHAYDSTVAAEIDPLLTLIQRMLSTTASDSSARGPSWFDLQSELPDTRVGESAPRVECWCKHAGGATIVHIRNCGGCAVRLLGIESIPPSGIADEHDLAFAGEFVGFRDGDGHPTGGAPILVPRGEGLVRLTLGDGGGVRPLPPRAPVTVRVITDAGSVDIPVGTARGESR